MRLKLFKPELKEDALCRSYSYNNVFQVGFDQLGEALDESLAKSQVISFDGESSASKIKSGTTSKRSVRQAETSNQSEACNGHIFMVLSGFCRTTEVMRIV